MPASTGLADDAIASPAESVARGLARGRKAWGLRWVEDESNLSDRYRRNALRLEVMPRLREYFPGCERTLARAATHQAETAGLLDELARIDAAGALLDTPIGTRLDCRALAGLSPARARNLLRYFIAQHGVALPNARRLDEARQQLGSARHDARVRVEFGQAALWGWRGGAYVVAACPLPEPVIWRGETELGLPGLGVLGFRLPSGRDYARAGWLGVRSSSDAGAVASCCVCVLGRYAQPQNPAPDEWGAALVTGAPAGSGVR